MLADDKQMVSNIFAGLNGDQTICKTAISVITQIAKIKLF